MGKHLTVFLFVFFLSTGIIAQHIIERNDGRKIILYPNYTWSFADSVSQYFQTITNLKEIALPHVNKSCQLVQHSAYTLCYNNAHEQSEWVAYMLTSDYVRKNVERTNKFLVDPKIKEGSATDADYKNSGYDRGHLAPAADMAYSSTTMRESFYYSNMTPQIPSFNRGVWKKLEEQVRGWAMEFDTIFIATGAVLKNGLPYIGPNKVSVPELYYKAILVYNNKHIQAIGFILKHEPTIANLQQFVVTVDSLEILTGINFFAKIPDQIAAMVESEVFPDQWKWLNDRQTDKSTNKNSSTNPSQTNQCKAIAVSTGNRCRNYTKYENGFCGIHQSQKSNSTNDASVKSSVNSMLVQCSGTTKKGLRCKRKTTNSSGRCFQHEGS